MSLTHDVTPEALDVLFRARMRSRPGAAMAGLEGTAVFDTGRAAWTLTVDADHLDVARGARPHPTVSVRCDLDTLAAVIDGRESGAAAFHEGRLTMRGRIGFGLVLDGAFEPPAVRPVNAPRSDRVTAMGVDTTFLDAGPEEGPVALMLHGLGATNASLMPAILDLARDHRVIAPDLPGHGMSEAPRWHYEPADFAHWVYAFLNRLDVEQAVIVGNSLGGRVALETGLRYPESVSSLVLFCPSAAFRKLRQMVPAVRLIPPRLGRLPLPVNHGIVVRALRGMFADPHRLPDSSHDAAADEFAAVMRSADHRYAFFSALRQVYVEEAFGAQGFWDRLPHLAPPALFLWGREDRLVPAGFARHVESCLPEATSVILEDCGHVPQFEHPEITMRLVREFLETGRVVTEPGTTRGFPESS